VNFGNHWLRQGNDGLHHRRATPEQIGKGGSPLIRRSAGCLHFLQIVACAKRPPDAAQDHHADTAVSCKLRQLIGQRGNHRIAERIEPPRVVQRQGRNPALIGTQQKRSSHWSGSICWKRRSGSSGTDRQSGRSNLCVPRVQVSLWRV